MPEEMPKDKQLDSACLHKAADVGFDLTKQFLTLAFAGIAFVVGLTFNKPGVVSNLLLWCIVGALCISVVLGLVFFMRGVGQLGSEGKCDIYVPALRMLSAFQIIFVLVGVILLIPVINSGNGVNKKPGPAVTVKMGKDQEVSLPVDPSKDLEISIDGSKVQISTKSSPNKALEGAP